MLTSRILNSLKSSADFPFNEKATEQFGNSGEAIKWCFDTIDGTEG